MSNNIHIIFVTLSDKQVAELRYNYKLGDKVVVFDLYASVNNISDLNIQLISETDWKGNDLVNDFYKQINNNSFSDCILAYSDIITLNIIKWLDIFTSVINEHLDCSSDIFIYSAKCYEKSLPITGYKTAEILKGSKDLVGGLISKILIDSNEDFMFRTSLRNPDLLSYPFIRRSAIFLYENYSLVKLISKVAKLSRKELEIRKPIVTFIARTPQHLAYIRTICKNGANNAFKVIVIPQARQGNIDELNVLIESMPVNVIIVKPNLVKIIGVYIKYLATKAFRSRVKNDIELSLTPKKQVTIPEQELVRECSHLFLDQIYNELIGHMIDYNERVVSFSMKGRYSYFEHIACKKKGCEHIIVQTANLTSFPSAIFPLSNYFYANSMTSLEVIKNNGLTTNGTVSYEGCPEHLKKYDLSSDDFIKRITFFTQPYDIETNILIINVMLDWCFINKVDFILKLHPRDSEKNYGDILEHNKNKIILDNNRYSYDAIRKTDLVVSRTSGVLDEALAEGVPFISCLFTHYDRKIGSGLIKTILDNKHMATKPEQLTFLLNNISLVRKRCENIQFKIFLGKDINNLTNYIIGYSDD